MLDRCISCHMHYDEHTLCSVSLACKRTFTVFGTATRASEMWKNPLSVVYGKCGVCVCSALRGAVQLPSCAVS